MSGISEEVIQRARKIKLVIFDVDGVLSDGKLYFYDQDLECKAFHVHDGVGIENLLKMQIQVAIITKRTSKLLSKRFEQLGISYVYEGQADKRKAYFELLKMLDLSHEQVAYVGDDLVDLPVMNQVGLSIAVHNAIDYVADQCHFQTTLPGGQGAAREVSDLILLAQGLLENILEDYQ